MPPYIKNLLFLQLFYFLHIYYIIFFYKNQISSFDLERGRSYFAFYLFCRVCQPLSHISRNGRAGGSLLLKIHALWPRWCLRWDSNSRQGAFRIVYRVSLIAFALGPNSPAELLKHIWYFGWDSNPQILVSKTNAYANSATKAYSRWRAYCFINSLDPIEPSPNALGTLLGTNHLFVF